MQQPYAAMRRLLKWVLSSDPPQLLPEPPGLLPPFPRLK